MGIVTKHNSLGGYSKYYVFRVTAIPQTAVITINGSVQSTVTVKKGTIINWRASVSGYSAQQGSLILDKDTLIDVELPVTQFHVFEIRTVPSNADVYINDVKQNTIKVELGTTVIYRVEKNGYITKSDNHTVIEDTVFNVSLEKQKYNFSIVCNVEGAEIRINNLLQASALISFDDTVNWSVSKYGYATQNGSMQVIEDTTITVELLQVPFYTFTLTALPNDAAITINGKNCSSATIEQNAVVAWIVSRDGYETKNGVFNITEHTVLNVVLEKKQFVFNLTALPLDSVIKINGFVQNSIICDFQTEVEYEVSHYGYKSQSGTHIFVDNETKNIVLVKEQYTYTINPDPADSVVYINGVLQSSVTADFETVITLSVSRAGYKSHFSTAIITENFVNAIILEKNQYTLTINPNIEDSVVTLNGVIQNSTTVDYGTSVNWIVTKNGYTPQSGILTLTQDTTLDIILQKALFTLTIAPIPTDSIVLINATEQKSVTVEYGTVIQYAVSHDGYETLEGEYTVLSDKVLDIALVPKKYRFSINTTPSGAVVTINGIEQSFIVVNYGTAVSWSVVSVGYVTQSGSYTVLSDTSKDVLLLQAYHTLTITPSPSSAVVNINGVIQRSITVVYGTIVSWSVSNPYYITQNGSEALTSTYAKAVNLIENITSVSLSSGNSMASPSSSYHKSTGSEVSWVIGTTAVSTSGLSAYTINLQGFIVGPCRIKMSYSSGGYGSSGWTKDLVYWINSVYNVSNTVSGSTAIIDLAAGEKLVKFGMDYSGNYVTISARTSASCSFSLYKYV